jgi:hypothetical protein
MDRAQKRKKTRKKRVKNDEKRAKNIVFDIILRAF